MSRNREEYMCPGCWSEHADCAHGPEDPCHYCGTPIMYHYSIVRAEAAPNVPVDVDAWTWELIGGTL